MINTITLKNVATFDDLGIQINDLKKLNFFFGYNGSGKSTIAKYIYNLSLEDAQKNPEFKDCSQTGYDKANHQILTFDESFTEENFNKSPVLKGVFSLNQKNDEIDKQIAKEEALIKDYDRYIESKKSLKDSIEKDRIQKQSSLLEYCWSQRSTFATFTKISLAHSGSKPNHLQEIKHRLQAIVTIKTIQQLTDTYKLLYEQEIEAITLKINADCYKQIRKIELPLEKLLQEMF